MHALRSFIPPLAVMLMAASGGASAQGVLIDKSEIRFVTKQMGASVEGRFRKWKANVDFRPEGPRALEGGFRDRAREHRPRERGDRRTRSRRRSGSTPRSSRSRSSHPRRCEASAATATKSTGTMSIKGVARDVVVPVALRKDPSATASPRGSSRSSASISRSARASGPTPRPLPTTSTSASGWCCRP